MKRKREEKTVIPVRILNEPKFAVVFGFFDIYPSFMIDAEPFISDRDIKAFKDLIEDDDPYIDTGVEVTKTSYIELLVEYSSKLANHCSFLEGNE